VLLVHEKLYHRLILALLLLSLTIVLITHNIKYYDIFDMYILALVSGIFTFISFIVFIHYLLQDDESYINTENNRKIIRYRSKIDSKLLCFCGIHEYTTIKEYRSRIKDGNYLYFDSVCIHCKHINKNATIKEEEEDIILQPNDKKIHDAKMHYWNSLTAEQKAKLFLEKL